MCPLSLAVNVLVLQLLQEGGRGFPEGAETAAAVGDADNKGAAFSVGFIGASGAAGDPCVLGIY